MINADGGHQIEFRVAKRNLQGISLQAAQLAVRRAELSRASLSGRLDGAVEASWTGSVGTVRARTDLNATDYHTAWTAHGHNQPITLQGVVRRVGRSFRIDNVSGFRLLEQTLTPQTGGT